MSGNWLPIAASSTNTAAPRADNTLWVWVYNGNNQLAPTPPTTK